MKPIKNIIDNRSANIESPVEKLMFQEFIKYEKLNFVMQYKIGSYRVDFAFPEYKLAFEVDGNEYHASDSQITRDKLRDEYLHEVEGWRVYRVPAWFCFRHPEIAAIKVLEHVPYLKEDKYFIHNRRKMVMYFSKELINMGAKRAGLSLIKNMK